MTDSVDALADGLRRSVPVKEVAVWLETWVAEDSAARHYYASFARGTVGLDAVDREITRPVTAADEEHLDEGYRVGDPTARFDSVRHAVVAAVTKARERWGADVTVSSERRTARRRSACRPTPILRRARSTSWRSDYPNKYQFSPSRNRFAPPRQGWNPTRSLDAE